VRAALFRYKQTGDLTLHLGRDKDRARLRQRLHPSGDVGDVTINLTVRVENGWAGFKANASDEFRLGRSGVLAIELRQGTLDGKRGAARAFGVVLMRQRIAKQAHQAVAKFFRDVATHFGDHSGSTVEISADEVAPLLGIELRGNARRTDEVAEHHRKVAAFASGLR
jgi:hypothetical protein